jgi:heme-degrading monooxygenase HmoA
VFAPRFPAYGSAWYSYRIVYPHFCRDSQKIGTLTGDNVIMITAGMSYRVIEGKQRVFEDKFASVLDALQSAKGHDNSTLWKDVSDDSSYLITSEWSDEQAFTDFIHSDAFRAVANWGEEQVLSGRPQHKIYRSSGE